MLFNSYPFLLVFLPAALCVQALVERFSPRIRLQSLLALSFIFYGYWDWRFVPLMAASILVNFAIIRLFAARQPPFLIAVAIAMNLAVLGVFKYTNFVGANLGWLLGRPMPHFDIALPLGISFFTFHHIMYLVDLRRGRAPLYAFDR